MKRLSTLLLGALLFGSLLYADASSAVYHGHKTYIVKLKGSFKQDASTFAASFTAKEWSLLFDDDAAAFIDLYSQRYPKASRYLHSERFKKSIPALRAFVIAYAKDTGQSPRCTCAL